MPTARILVLGVAATGLLVSCAGQGDQDAATDATDPREEILSEGQRPPTPAPSEESADALGPFPDPPVAVRGPAQSPPTAEETTAPEAASGQPEWWFEGVEIEGGRASLCAEATGESLLDVKRAVVDVARAALREAFDLEGEGELPGEKIERIMATPRAGEDGAIAYVGHVAISIAAPDQN